VESNILASVADHLWGPLGRPVQLVLGWLYLTGQTRRDRQITTQKHSSCQILAAVNQRISFCLDVRYVIQ